MRRPYLLGLLALTLMLASVAAPLGAQASLHLTGWGKARIVDPEYSRPLAVDAGAEANVTLICPGECNPPYSVELVSFNRTVALASNAINYGNGTIVLTFQVPDETPDDLYDIIVYANGSKIAWMPRALWVKHGKLEALTIMHLTDTHLGASDKGIPNTLKNTRYVMLSDLVSRLYGVNVVFVTGDIVDVGSDVPSLKATWEEFNQFRLPTFMVPGNHDWAQVPNIEAFLQNYYGRYINSKQYWYRIVDNFIIIGLDSLGDGYLPDYELKFLNETLNAYPDKTAILLFHHPIFNQPGEYEGPVDNWINNVYSSWKEHENSLRTFIKIVEEHPNVALVMTGHIHRDADAILHIGDRKVYFITTTTANHGTPTYWGFKIVKIYENGTVQVILPPGKDDLFNGRTSFNTEYYKTYEVANDNRTTVVWQLYASRLAELEVSNVTLYFYMNSTGGPYKVYDKEGLVHDYKVYSYGDYIVYVVHAKVPSDKTSYVVVSDHEDTLPPVIGGLRISPSKPRAGQPLFIYVSVDDNKGGWGLAGVKIKYRVQGGEWQDATLSMRGNLYVATIKKTPAGIVEIEVSAWDYNENYANKTITLKVESPTTTTTTTPATTTTTTTTMASTVTETTTSQTTTTTTTGETVETTASQEGGGTTQLAVAAIIAIIVVALIAILVKR